MEEWINKMWYIQQRNIIQPSKEGNPITCATTWMNLEDSSETSQSQKDKFCCCCCCCCLFRVAPAAYGGSQVRGRIGAVATGLCHSHSHIRCELYLRPTCATAHGNTVILNALGEASDRTCILMDTSQICFY